MCDKKSNIILCSDQQVNINGVTTVDVQEIVSTQTSNIMNSSYFKFDSNPLWKRSLYRIFLLRDVARKLNLDKFVHFDSDVILYRAVSEFEDYFSKFSGFYITPCNQNELVFGFSFCNDLDKYETICDLVFEISVSPDLQKRLCPTMPNEMEILGAIKNNTKNLIIELPIIPDEETTFVFDPSSYGQYFGGTHNNEPVGWAGNHHWIGKKINEGRLKPIMLDKIPFVVYKERKIPIVNLHIHSKKTKEFV